MVNLTGAAAIVTGSASGIGAATAKLLAARGCHVLVNYSRSADEAEAVAADCRGHGVTCVVHKANIADDGACRAMVQAAVEAFGRLDILVNNAGMTKPNPSGDLDALSGQDFLDVYAVNLVGTYQMIRAAVPHLKASGAGRIVNVSALGALTGEGSSVAYAASKGALNSLTLSMARQLAPLIRVNAVCPGFVATRWIKNMIGEERYAARIDEMAATTLVGKTAFPEDIAEMILWFIDGPGLLTGEVLAIDYGTRFGRRPPAEARV